MPIAARSHISKCEDVRSTLQWGFPTKALSHRAKLQATKSMIEIILDRNYIQASKPLTPRV